MSKLSSPHVKRRRRKGGQRTQRLPGQHRERQDWSDCSSATGRPRGAPRPPPEELAECSPRDRLVERLPRDVILDILPHLRPPDIIALLNASPSLRRRIDTQELWKGCWYWLAEEFSGAVTAHRLLHRIGLPHAFDWKMLVLLDWRFQYKDLNTKLIRSSAKETCAKVREVGLVLRVEKTEEAVAKVHGLLKALKKVDCYFCRDPQDDPDTASTEDEYDHDKEWETTIVSGMALATVRREALADLDLPPGVDIDRLPHCYETAFAPYREICVA